MNTIGSVPVKRMFGWVVFYPSPYAPYACPIEVQYRTRALARAARRYERSLREIADFLINNKGA